MFLYTRLKPGETHRRPASSACWRGYHGEAEEAAPLCSLDVDDQQKYFFEDNVF